jgi:hypothetical protein
MWLAPDFAAAISRQRKNYIRRLPATARLRDARSGGLTNLNGSSLSSLVIEDRTNDPPSPATGRIWLRTDL